MVDEVYARLSRHAATTTGTSASFRLDRRGVSEGLTISPAFIEQIHLLERRLSSLEIGRINADALGSFLRLGWRRAVWQLAF
jgi:hypothetical protein